MKMNKKEAKERIEKLRKLIEYHRTLYHVFDSPEIDDEVFDALKNELEELERRFPDLITPESPTQTIGGKPLDKFQRVKHLKPMLSFYDAFGEKEMKEWLERLEKYLGRPLEEISDPNFPLFYCELKIDGLAIELVYEEGLFVQGSTRGDGLVGEDVTQNLKTIKSIPQKLEQLGKYPIPKRLVVRGEVFISKKELLAINRQQKKMGLKPYSNTRNLAAGSVRQLDPKITALRKLDSFQYAIVTDVGQKSHEEEHKILASWGFKINPYNRSAKSLEEVFRFHHFWEKKRESLEYEIDGIVVIVNDNSVFERAGVIGKGPRAAIAYKFSPRQATTVVKDVKIQVGRTGILTPVAILDPVEVGGVMVNRSTLHNFEEIKRLDLKIGDTVIITRSGDVIPKILQVLKELRTGREKEIKVPNTCPVDGSFLKKEGLLVRCSNPRCGAKNKEAIIHFVSREAFNIKGLGKKIINRFLDEGLISNAADIFFLRKEEIAFLKGFGEKSASNIINEIKASREITLDKFFYALGILHVGQETAKALARKFQSQFSFLTIEGVINFFEKIPLEELKEISDIGEKVALSIKNWFSSKENKNFLKKLSQAGIRLIPLKEKTLGILKGLNVCLTGTLKSMSRQQAKELIENNGGHFCSSLTSSVNLVIAGENPGSKYKKALEKKLEIWDEKKFLEKIRFKRG